MHAIGLIVGHGYAKAVCGARMACFPAVAALAAAHEYESSLGRGPQTLPLQGQGDWLIGDDALTFAPQRLVSILDRSRYSDPSFVALARHALQQVVSGPGALTIMTGMPAAWFADATARAALERAIRHAAVPWGAAEVLLAPEAAGVYYAYVFADGRLDPSRTRGQVGVIDAGYRDVNVALFADGRYVRGQSVPGGMADALNGIARRIAQSYGIELPLHAVDAAVRHGGLRIAGALHPLPGGTEEDLHRGLSGLLGVARSLWPNGGKMLEAVVLGGGGAVVLAAALRAAFSQLVVPGAELRGCPEAQLGAQLVAADPQLAGARGFALAALAHLARRSERSSGVVGR